VSLEHSPARAKKDALTFADPSYTVDEFCRVERMSRSALYKQWQQGKGPRFYLVGNSRRISAQARSISAIENRLPRPRWRRWRSHDPPRGAGAGATQRKEATPTNCPPPWLATDSGGRAGARTFPQARRRRRRSSPPRRSSHT
jgi:hypothetical protein